MWSCLNVILAYRNYLIKRRGAFFSFFFPVWLGAALIRVRRLFEGGAYQQICREDGVIYKESWLPIMMIEHTIFARSNIILSDQNACLLSHNIMAEGFYENFARSYDRGSTL